MNCCIAQPGARFEDAKRKDCAKIVEALSQGTMCVVEKVEKQSMLMVWDKVKQLSP